MTLENLVDCKTVAVVGNSESLFSKEYGSEIDSHDIVIRFNKPANFYYHHDVSKSHGEKTTVWMFWSIGAFIKHVINSDKGKDLDKLKSHFFDRNTNVIKAQATPNGYTEYNEICDITCNNLLFSSITKRIKSQSTYKEKSDVLRFQNSIKTIGTKVQDINISVGTITLDWLRHSNARKISVYGFDFKRSPTYSEINEYFTDMKDRFDSRCMHLFDLEEVYSNRFIFTDNRFVHRS